MRKKLFLNFVAGILILLAVVGWAGGVFADISVPPEMSESWRDRISIAKYKNWAEGDSHLFVSPTMDGNKIYIPYDISDAWRELDHMLPESYKDKVARNFDGSCGSENVSDELFNLSWNLVLFLADEWFGSDSSRLLKFFEIYYGLSKEKSFLNENREVFINIILCGYYSKEVNGVYPDIDYVIRMFGRGLVR